MDRDIAASMPAHKTFQASRDDVLTNLAFFLGDPVSPEKLKDYSEAHAATYHFPDAFYGQNTKIRETLNSLILKTPDSWQTSVGLPFVQITGTVVEWDEMRFDVRLLQRVPYEGVSRMQTSLRRRHRDRIVRRGIGMMLESDFYATEQGRQHFSDQLTSIRYCVQETCNFDAIFAYLTASNYDFKYDMTKGLRPRRSVRAAMAHEIQFYAIVQKEGRGFDKAIEEAKARMSRYSVSPNMLVLPPQMLLYIATAPEEKINYAIAGPSGPANFEAGVAGYEARQYRGLGVFTSTPYEVNDDSDSIQMLQRSTQVGEFYRMKMPRTWRRQPSAQDYDIIIYDEEADSHVHITITEALYAAGVGIADAAWPDVFDVSDAAGDLDNAKEAVAFSKASNGVNGATDPATPLDKITKKALVAGGADLVKEIVAALNAGAVLPIAVCVVRPFIEHRMMSAILTVAGRDTGATLYGPADMQLSANTSVKTIEGHFTCHTKSVVTKPQNVLVLRDIMCSGYVAGGNTRWFGQKTTMGNYAKLSKPIAFDAVKNSIHQRLMFEDDAAGEYESMLAFLVPVSDGERRDQVISISPRLLPWEVTMPVGEQHSYFPGGSAHYAFYKGKYGLDQLHFGEDVRAVENQDFVTQGSINNSLCFVGPHRVFSPWSNTYYSLEVGQGHFGPDAVPGDARWRRGESVSLEAARSSMVSLETAAHSALVFNKGGP